MNQIIEIVNLWDPIGLFPMAPKDEYEAECKEIYRFLENNKKIKEKELAEKINDIFSKRFGVDVYNSKARKKCYDVSREILKAIKV